MERPSESEFYRRQKAGSSKSIEKPNNEEEKNNKKKKITTISKDQLSTTVEKALSEKTRQTKKSERKSKEPVQKKTNKQKKIQYEVDKKKVTNRIRLETRDYTNAINPHSFQYQLVFCIIVAEYQVVTEQDYFHICPLDPRLYTKTTDKEEQKNTEEKGKGKEKAVISSDSNEEMDDMPKKSISKKNANKQKEIVIEPDVAKCRMVCSRKPGYTKDCNCHHQRIPCDLICSKMFLGNVRFKYVTSFPYTGCPI